jgi:glycosidase
VAVPKGQRALFFVQLHRTYEPHRFDNWMVWAGNLSIQLDGERFSPTLARAFVGPGHPQAPARVRAELFVAALPSAQVREGEVDVRLWTDADQRGQLDAEGRFQPGVGRHLPMRLVCDPQGLPLLSGQNLVFESEAFTFSTTGVFNYTVQFSADPLPLDDPQKEWLGLSQLARNQDGVVVVSPLWLSRCPSLMEVCVRKVGARLEGGRFQSGRFAKLTAQLDQLPVDVVYLLPFFKPGFTDLHRGEDVRKGALGSPYAVADFFQLDPELVTPPEEADLGALVREGLVRESDVDGWGVGLAELGQMGAAQALALRGRKALVQLIGRAELRQLTRRAHQLGKRVIFDLVLMQTSRDNPLIRQRPEWYVRDEEGRPAIHRIAWLVYSDVALFDLVFNQELQEYLLGVAPYWIAQCDLDGVRIDASQTVDRPFLKRIKNRIAAVQPEALVLGETLCALDQAVDVPTDAIYALLVDFHRDVEHARPLIQFLEEMHARFAARTLALAYFENHDSPRATQVWREKFAHRLQEEPEAARYWRELSCPVQPEGEERPLLMALLKNLQATLIDLSAGLAGRSNLFCGLEWGSPWGEEERTDFENPTLLQPHLGQEQPRAALVQAYQLLHQCRPAWEEFSTGLVYYQRNEFAGGDPEDRVLAYTRYTGQGAMLVLHNLDYRRPRTLSYTFEYLPFAVETPQILFDTYAAFQLPAPAPPAKDTQGFTFDIQPLQSTVLRLR